MSKTKKIKVKQNDGTWIEVDLGADAVNISYRTKNLQDALDNGLISEEERKELENIKTVEYESSPGIDPNTTTSHLILTNHSNGPGDGYWYIRTYFYADQKCQIAQSYSTIGLYMRTYYNGTWFAWRQIISSEGGVVTGKITKPGTSSSWWQGRDYCLISTTTTPSSSQYMPLTSMKSVTGSYEIGTYGDAVYVSYVSNSEYNKKGTPVHCLKVDYTGSGTIKAMHMSPSAENGGTLGTAGAVWDKLWCNKLEGWHYAIYDSGNTTVFAQGSTEGVAFRSKFNINDGVPIQASAFNQWSSRRYKENIQSMSEEEADKILNIEAVTFDYKNKNNGVNKRGFIAEDVYEYIPSTVQTKKDEDGNMIPDSIDYSSFVPYLVKKIQMMDKEIKELKAAANLN